MDSPKKILLAECDAFLINVYSSQLRKSGYSTSIAQDGEIAINRVKTLSPDLLILSASLPKSGGLSVLKTLRKDSGLKNLKVIMLSDFSQAGEMENSTALGVNKYFIKAESTAEEIVNEIKRILS